MKKSVLGLTAASVAALAAGCSSSGSRSPDEFRVVRKAPLSVPPEYNLRPPATGESLPVELQREETARAILFGQLVGTQASEGERMFVAKAGADAIDPKIRGTVDYESSDTLRKNKSFSDKVLSFGSSRTNLVVNPDAEAQRLEQEYIDNATGGGDVVIKRKSGGSKLPGL